MSKSFNGYKPKRVRVVHHRHLKREFKNRKIRARLIKVRLNLKSLLTTDLLEQTFHHSYVRTNSSLSLSQMNISKRKIKYHPKHNNDKKIINSYNHTANAVRLFDDPEEINSAINIQSYSSGDRGHSTHDMKVSDMISSADAISSF